MKWLPACVVPAVVIAAVIAVPLQAGAAVDLPDKTAEQVLQLVNDSTVSAFSGSVVQSSDLGLPSLDVSAGMAGSMPTDTSDSGSGMSSADALRTALELLSGSHEFRVYVGGEAQSRVQIKDRMAERDLIRNGNELWYYDSNTNEATHLSAPADLAASAQTKFAKLQAQLPTDLSTPALLAERFLAALDPSTAVEVGPDAQVAGRSAYQLLLTPRTAETLVASVSIAVDSETGLPLEVTVLARGQSAPALQIAFTTIDFAAVNASRFDFVPPATATVTEQSVPARPDAPRGDHMRAADVAPVVTGTGWSTVVELPAVAVPAELNDNPLIEQLMVSVDGGRALTASLVTVFLASDGRIFAGAVPLAQLQAAAE
ncbi:DUF2092 domain-containing protein [Cryobacterium suzukii]|uniref:DUF2092 domain-containing protein n=1 Tax=Cryobacterium suzukii TaxID=1259198 RepID=A0A4R9ADK5_9MICO|nr:DUF2092 domain-containing protein [Cryobacterium suzukii]